MLHSIPKIGRIITAVVTEASAIGCVITANGNYNRNNHWDFRFGNTGRFRNLETANSDAFSVCKIIK